MDILEYTEEITIPSIIFLPLKARSKTTRVRDGYSCKGLQGNESFARKI